MKNRKDTRKITDCWILVFWCAFSGMASAQIKSVEYWFDNDFVGRSALSITENQSLQITELNASSLPAGIHQLHIRAKDSWGHYSAVHSQVFYKLPAHAGANAIAGYEYWWDNGFDDRIPVAATGETLTITDGFDMSALSQGIHVIYIRAKDNRGYWSSVHAQTFYINSLTSEGENLIAACHDWYGLEFEEGSVRRFNLTKNNLTGTLPVAVLSGFPHLQTLTVDSNSVFLEEALPALLTVNIKAQEFDCGSILVDKTIALDLPIYDISRYAHASGTFSTNNRFSIYVNDTYKTRVSASDNTVSLSKTYAGNLIEGDLLKLVQYEGETAGSVYTYTVTFGTPAINVEPSAGIRIYPNPVSENFRIIGITAPTQVIVTDATGKAVLQQTVRGDESITVGQLPKGVYLVRMNETTEKVIKN
jgi:hypothetical protein